MIGKVQRLLFYFFIFVLLTCAVVVWRFPQILRILNPFYESVQAPPDSELGKLIQVIDFYRTQDIKVIYDGNEYTAEWGWRFAREYLTQHIRDLDDAEAWIREHTYRTVRKGNIIYFEYPDGEKVPMRDVFLAKLASLRTAPEKP